MSIDGCVTPVILGKKVCYAFSPQSLLQPGVTKINDLLYKILEICDGSRPIATLAEIAQVEISELITSLNVLMGMGFFVEATSFQENIK